MELLIQVARITRLTLFCFDLAWRGEVGMTFDCQVYHSIFWGEVMQKLEMICTEGMFFKLFPFVQKCSFKHIAICNRLSIFGFLSLF